LEEWEDKFRQELPDHDTDEREKEDQHLPP
jgi:hypothetical protein